MSLLKKVAGRINGWVETRIQNATYSQEVMDTFGVMHGAPSASGEVVTSTSSKNVAAVFACVQKIAGPLSTLPLNIYKIGEDEQPVKQPRNTLWRLLNLEPHQQFSAASFWEGVGQNTLLSGDSHAYIWRRMDGSIRGFLPMPWSSVHPYRQTDGSVRYYICLPDYNIKTWLEPSDILHFPGVGFDGLSSESIIKYAAKNAVGNALAMDKYSGKFFSGGSHPSIILESDSKIGDPQLKSLQSAFASKYSGTENAHKLPLVLSEGVKAKPISLSAEDAQLLEARKFQVIDIARAFGVPPHMIGETSSSTAWGTGLESISRSFVTYTLLPHLVRIEQELTRKLFPQSVNMSVKFDREALIEADLAAQSNYYRQALGGPGAGQGWMTADEVRKKTRLAPRGGSADKLFDPSATTDEGNQE